MSVAEEHAIPGMSEEELKEALKDPHWRLRNLYYVKDKDKKTVLFRPNEVQEKFIEELWYRNVVPKARQRGFSTVVQILILDTCIFVPDTDSGIIAQDVEKAKQIRDSKIKFAWDRLPTMVKRMNPLVIDNITELKWENGSRMTVSTSARGGTPNMLHISEYGIICLHDPEKANEIQEGSLPAVPTSGIVVIESTVESPYGLFSDMVRSAMADQDSGRVLTPLDYRLHFASWWDADEYELEPEGIIISDKDKKYFDQTETKIGREIGPRKRAWYVTERKNTFGGVNEKMWRQYPSTLEEAFQVATDGLWLAESMALARREGRITDVPFMPGIPVNTFFDLGIDDETSIWLHQSVGAWDHFINFIEGAGEAPAYYVRRMQEEQQEHGYVWGKHFLPHDGANRHPGAQTLTTYADIYEGLGLRNIEIVPRTDDVTVAIDLMRLDFTSYRIDQTRCAEGVKHLDGFMKVWNARMQGWTGAIAKNGHQHAADAIRQKAQAKEAGLMLGSPGGGQQRPKRRNSGGRVA